VSFNLTVGILCIHRAVARSRTPLRGLHQGLQREEASRSSHPAAIKTALVIRTPSRRCRTRINLHRCRGAILSWYNYLLYEPPISASCSSLSRNSSSSGHTSSNSYCSRVRADFCVDACYVHASLHVWWPSFVRILLPRDVYSGMGVPGIRNPCSKSAFAPWLPL